MSSETVTLIILGVVILGLLAILVWVLNEQSKERLDWEEERKMLVDRAIARHAGEVIAFDRADKPKTERAETQVIYPEGL